MIAGGQVSVSILGPSHTGRNWEHCSRLRHVSLAHTAAARLVFVGLFPIVWASALALFSIEHMSQPHKPVFEPSGRDETTPTKATRSELPSGLWTSTTVAFNDGRSTRVPESRQSSVFPCLGTNHPQARGALHLRPAWRLISGFPSPTLLAPFAEAGPQCS